MTQIINGQLVSRVKLHNSHNGNPRYRLRIYTVAETISLVTKTDGQVGYYATNFKIGEWCIFEVSGIKRQTIVAITKDITL